jgi:vesicle-associated membrane protein 7
MTYQYDNYVFHYMVEGSLCYLSMSDENKHRIPYAFLSDIQNHFVAKYGMEAPLLANAFSYNEEFSKTIQERMDFYNSDAAEATVDNIGAVKNQIDDVKETMIQNISNILERGERLELLVEKTDNLNQQAFRFEVSSHRLRRTMYWRKMRCYIGIGAAVVFLIIVASASMCGGLDYHHCRGKK